MSTDGKMIINVAYHATVVATLAMGYARLGKMIFKGATPKLDFTGFDLGMVVLDLSLAMASRDLLIKQGLLPADILK